MSAFSDVPIKFLHRYLQKVYPKIIDGVARVGGRLSQTLIDFEMKFPEWWTLTNY